MLRRVGVPLLTAVLAASLIMPSAVAAPAFPTTIALPNGFQPEGIAIGPGPVAYLGSLADGSIYRASLITGRGTIVSEGPGTPSVGLKTDARGRLFVSGGAAGDARVVDTRTGKILKSYQLASGESFVNDVVLTRSAAWFTDSLNQVLYKLPLRHGKLPDRAVTVPITGDLVYQDGFNANGIARTPDGEGLLVVQSNTGQLFRVSTSGVSTRVELADALTNGDGLLLRGRTLYVVQNRLNTVAVLRLDHSASSARVVDRLTDERFDVPTTVGAFGGRLYLPNARFNTPPEPTTPYQVVAIRP
ncbi:SMP-30/gluconolactonase/LRE family protein [Actinophytocola sp.]|uniref:SMP-30/gluconolactonase/LRE family protein n=1 Tax=Actinophytocola sp. TaxID=1872138 RepID=UPI003D6B34DA